VEAGNRGRREIEEERGEERRGERTYVVRD
jgi:hypothetical protein